MAGSSKQTTDHETIRTWAEERGGRPARVSGTGAGDDPGILRIDFPIDEDNLEQISWDEWLEAFEENELAFVYQEQTTDGEASRFSKSSTSG